MQQQLIGSAARKVRAERVPWHPRLTQGLRLSPAGQFLAVSLLVISLGLAVAGWWINSQIERRVLDHASSTASVYLRSIIAPLLQGIDNTRALPPAMAARLDALLREGPISEEVVGFVVWGLDGRVLYSTDSSQIDQVFPVDHDLREAWRGTTTWELNQDHAETHQPAQTRSRMLLVTYTPLRSQMGGEVFAVAEFYQDGDPLRTGIGVAQGGTWLVIVVVGSLMYLSLSGFVGSISETILRQQGALAAQVVQLTDLLHEIEQLHERVRRATRRATAHNERFLRRLSAEVHDGPAQYLGASLLHLDRLASFYEGNPAHAETIEHIDLAQVSLSQALEELRAIAAGLGLPHLALLSLEDTVQRAAGAHERRTQTTVAVSLSPLPATASLAAKITLYRVIQESLTNAHRHAGGSGQRVSVWADETQIYAEISDAGPGFREASSADSHLGLAGMRERVECLGGSFTIRSEPGRGCTVHAAIPLAGSDDEIDPAVQPYKEQL